MSFSVNIIESTKILLTMSSHSFTIPNTPPAAPSSNASGQGANPFLFKANPLAPIPESPAPNPPFASNNPTTGFSFGAQRPQSSFFPSSAGGTQSLPSSMALPFSAPASSFGAVMPQIANTPAPYPRDTKFEELPESVRAALQALERTIREHQTQLVRIDVPKFAPLESDDGSFSLEESALSIEQVGEQLRGTQQTLKVIRKRQAALWRSAELTAAQLLSTRVVLSDGRAVFRLSPQSSSASHSSMSFLGRQNGALDLGALADQAQNQLNSLTRQADIVRRRWQAVMAPSSTLSTTQESTVKEATAKESNIMIGNGAKRRAALLRDSLESQDKALNALSAKLTMLQDAVAKEREQYRRYLEKYRHVYNVDPFLQVNQ
jgi:hypothetical protein